MVRPAGQRPAEQMLGTAVAHMVTLRCDRYAHVADQHAQYQSRMAQARPPCAIGNFAPDGAQAFKCPLKPVAAAIDPRLQADAADPDIAADPLGHAGDFMRRGELLDGDIAGLVQARDAALALVAGFFECFRRAAGLVRPALAYRPVEFLQVRFFGRGSGMVQGIAFGEPGLPKGQTLFAIAKFSFPDSLQPGATERQYLPYR